MGLEDTEGFGEEPSTDAGVLRVGMDGEAGEVPVTAEHVAEGVTDEVAVQFGDEEEGGAREPSVEFFARVAPEGFEAGVVDAEDGWEVTFGGGADEDVLPNGECAGWGDELVGDDRVCTAEACSGKFGDGPCHVADVGEGVEVTGGE